MSAVATTKRIVEMSPRNRARVTGVVYLLFFLTAILGEVFSQQAGVSVISAAPSDAAATAHNILAHETFYRAGWALSLISIMCYVAVVCLFYQLFRPVNRSLALLAAFFGILAQATTAVGSLFQLAPLAVLGGSPYLHVFDAQQLQTLALLLLNLNVLIGYVALVFAGPFQLLIGYLIFRSSFLPRVLGVLIALAGVGWVTYLWPPLANTLLTPIAVLGFVAEAALMLWLLVFGVNAQRWNEQVLTAGA